ncbi:MAG TPA: hypothetical protein DGG94_00185 [Micromonosporaceae bacterium]|nr:hypothetical protein [Micromonosporaceae bacterium]
MRMAAANVSIDAPVELVWKVMLDLESYGLWNPFIVRVAARDTRDPRVGDDLKLHVRFKGGKAVVSPERITEMQHPLAEGELVRAALEYEFRGPLHLTGMVRGRRRQLLEQGSAGSTQYRTEEHFRGALAFIVPTGLVQDGFERHAQALKQRAEALA